MHREIQVNIRHPPQITAASPLPIVKPIRPRLAARLAPHKWARLFQVEAAKRREGGKTEEGTNIKGDSW